MSSSISNYGYPTTYDTQRGGRSSQSIYSWASPFLPTLQPCLHTANFHPHRAYYGTVPPTSKYQSYNPILLSTLTTFLPIPTTAFSTLPFSSSNKRDLYVHFRHNYDVPIPSTPTIYLLRTILQSLRHAGYGYVTLSPTRLLLHVPILYHLPYFLPPLR